MMNYHAAGVKISTGKKQAAVFVLSLLSAFSAVAQTRTLAYYINSCLSHSPLVNEFRNQAEMASLDSLIFRAGYLPQVEGISNNTYAPIIGGIGYDAQLTTTAYTTEVNASKKFIGRRNLATQYKAYSLLVDSIRNAKKISEQDLKKTVIAQYITAYGDQQQLIFYNTVHDLLADQETLLKKLTQNNIYKQTDYLTFLVTYKQQELQLKQLRIQFQNDFGMLNYLCGIFDTSAAMLNDPGVILDRLPDVSYSAFYQRYMIDSLKIQNSISILNYSYRPRLSAFANAGYSSTLLYQAQKNFGFSVGFNVRAPIYDGHQRRLQTQKLAVLENTNAGYRDFFTSQYNQQVAMLQQQLSATEALLNDINDQVRYAQGLIDVNGKLLRTGDARITDFIIAINNYLAAKNLLTQNNISRMQIINQLNYWNR
jgi:outer membrane protein TolC